MDKCLSPLNVVTKTTWLTSGGKGGIQGKAYMMLRMSRVSIANQQLVSNSTAIPARLSHTSLCWFFLSSTEGSEDEEEIVHMGNAIMSFYSALIDLLGRCAPEMHVSNRAPREQL